MHSQLRWVLLASSLAALGGGMLTPLYAVYVLDIGGDLLDAGVQPPGSILRSRSLSRV